MKILPLNKNEYQTFPLTDIVDGLEVYKQGVIEITEEQYLGLQNRTLQFSEDLKSVVPYKKSQKEIDNEKRAEIEQELSALHQYLDSHDYLINKVVLGELDSNSEEFQGYLKKRKETIIRINELEEELKEV